LHERAFESRHPGVGQENSMVVRALELFNKLFQAESEREMRLQTPLGANRGIVQRKMGQGKVPFGR